jgi:tetratricopeptide (TPR) repeat protein
MGDAAQAIEDHRAALALARDVGNRPEHARAHHGLALAQRDLGRPEQARVHAEQALDLYAQLGVREADEVRNILSELR